MKISLIKSVVLIWLMSMLVGCAQNDWRTATRQPAGLAPDPSIFLEPVIHVYGADAYSWRGWFAVHTWIAVKARNEPQYTVYEVVGWRVKRGLSALREYQTSTPDRYWYGSKPELILSVTGYEAEKLLPKITEAVARYPWAQEYVLFPGPNSNTFPAWIGKQVPELGLALPFRALGSGYAD